uniref:Triadin n=1 Tax=Sphenodon punctatus TaxID=8508 RepID=A0A8D0GQX3_SPHPU
MITTTTVIDGKNGTVPIPHVKVAKKSVTEDLVTTFSSPAAWLLIIALIITWSAVAIVMFDLVDYKTFAGKILYILTDPLRIIHEAVEESTDWIYGFISLLTDVIMADDDDSDEGIFNMKSCVTALTHVSHSLFWFIRFFVGVAWERARTHAPPTHPTRCSHGQTPSSRDVRTEPS